MPYRQPLTPWIKHVADPEDLPLRQPGEPGPGRVVRGEVVCVGPSGVTLAVTTSDGAELFAEIQAAGEGVVRVRLAPTEETTGLSDAALLLARPEETATAEVTRTPETVTIDAGLVRAVITLDPWRLCFTTGDGRILVEQNTDESDISRRLRVLPFGRSAHTDGRVAAYHETFSAPADEHFFGLGEKFTAVDKRGQRVVCWNYDAFSSESERSYKNVPFYLSTRGYGILVDSGTATEFDLCHSTHACVQITVPDAQLHYYVIAGPEPQRILDRLHRLTGRPHTPPKWALGTWMSTGYAPTDQDATLGSARLIRDRGLPCDVLHLDAYWQRSGQWSHLRWDREKFPDPEGMIRDIHELGFRLCLWMNPYLSQESPVFAEGDRLGHFLRGPDGGTYVADVWHGAQPSCGIVDFTRPEAVTWYQGLLRELLEQGVDVFKTDFGEGVPIDAVAWNGLRGNALHNVYSLLFNDVVADVTEEVRGHRVVWARSSFTGGQRHCGQWAGDTNSTWSAMGSTLRGGLSYAYSGVPFWSHDVGGFTGQPSPALLVRSAQFGAFSPLVRFHGTSSRFPWDYDATTEAAVVSALRMRYELLPYLYSASVEAARSGLPVIRPLGLAAPDEPGAWSAELEYLFGPDILVAPVTSADERRSLYLPGGADWVDYWTGARHAGGRHLFVSQPLERIPLFVRSNALLPTITAQDRTGDGPFPDVTLTSWGDVDSQCVVHDVDGTTSVRLTRVPAGAELTTSGPLRVRNVAFAAGSVPEHLIVNGVPARRDDTVRGDLFHC